jgi:DNA repair protein RadC
MKKNTDIKRLTDKELISTILEKKTDNPIDRRIISDVLSVIVMGDKKPKYEDLLPIPGVGIKSATKIMACFEIGRRYCATGNPLERITKPDDIIPFLSDIRAKNQEHFVCITLNGAGELLGNRVITVGLLNHSLVHPREVYADAITDRAASIIVAHNHPSGSLEPSPNDIAITVQLKEAGSLIGIQLIDHMIVTKTGYLSMRERGLV